MEQVGLKIENGILLAELSGEIDHHSASAIRKIIDSAMEQYRLRNMILDYSEVAFMDSSGIGLVLGRYKNICRRGGVLVIVPGSHAVARMFSLAGIFRMIPKSRSQGLALAYIQEREGRTL